MGHVDFIEHSLVTCPLLTLFWNEVYQTITQLINRPLSSQISIANKIFGVAKNNELNLSKTQIKVVNNILLIGKFAIIKARAQSSTNYILYFEEELRARRTALDQEV